MATHTTHREIIPARKLVLANIGEDGVGKTVCGLSISKQYPAEIPATKRVTITDTFHVCADLHALTSARKCGIDIESYFDIPEFLADREQWKAEHIVVGDTGKPFYSDAIRVALNKIAAWLKVHPHGNIILDTLSTMSSGLFSEYAEEATKTSGRFGLRMPADMRRIYGNLLGSMQLMADYLMAMDFGILLLLIHTKALVDMADDATAQMNAKNTRKAGKALEDAKIIPDAAGNGIKFFKHHVVLQFPIKATRAPQAKVRTRSFLTNPAAAESMEVKNKFEGMLADKEPANWLKILAKINASKQI